jgi:hypothetical protein
MNSYQAISYVNVDFVSNISEVVSVSIVRGDVMMETQTVSKMLDTNSTLTWLSTQNLTVYGHKHKHNQLQNYISCKVKSLLLS